MSNETTETTETDRLLTVDEMAAKLQVHRDTVLRWSQGARAKLPAVRFGQTVRFHWPTVAKRLGCAVAFLILLSPTTPAANPTFPELAASSAIRSAAGAPLSVTMRVPAGANGGAGSNTTAASLSSPHREFDGKVKGHSTVLSPLSSVRGASGGGDPKPRVGTGGAHASPVCTSPVGGVLPGNLGPTTTPAPSPRNTGDGRWYGIDLGKLAHAESRSRDEAVGASGERGRLQVTRAALADVNKLRRTRIRFASLTNAETSVAVARDYIAILAGRIRGSGVEPTPAAILCAWNDGLSDARRYGFDPDRAPYPTRRLIAAQ